MDVPGKALVNTFLRQAGFRSFEQNWGGGGWRCAEGFLSLGQAFYEMSPCDRHIQSLKNSLSLRVSAELWQAAA